MNIKKIFACSLLSLSIVPGMYAMESIEKEAATNYNNFLRNSLYNNLRNRELDTLADPADVICPNNTITYNQLRDIHSCVRNGIGGRQVNTWCSKMYYLSLACSMASDIKNYECDGRLSSFYKLYLTAAEPLHYLSYFITEDFDVNYMRYLIGDLADRDQITFEELKGALRETARVITGYAL